MKTLNSVKYQDVDLLNQNAMEGKYASISEGENGVQNMPPIIKVNDKISEEKVEPEERIFEESGKNSDYSDALPSLEKETVAQNQKDMSTETEKIQISEKDTQTLNNMVDTKDTQTQTFIPSSKDFGVQSDVPKRNFETQTDGMLSLKKCDKCNGLFSGMNNLLQHKKMFHKTPNQRLKRKNPVKNLKRKNSNDIFENNSKVQKLTRGEKRKAVDEDEGKGKKLKVSFAKEGEESIFDLTNKGKKKPSKSRSKEDLQNASGFKGIINSKNDSKQIKNNKLSFTHWFL